MATLVWQRACPCWDTFCPKKMIQGTDQLSHETSPGTSWLLPHQGWSGTTACPFAMHKSSSFPASTQVHRLLKNLVVTKGLIPRPSQLSRCQLKATGAKDCHQLTGFSSGKHPSCQTTLLLASLLLTLGTSHSQSSMSESLNHFICGRSRTKGCKR